MRLLSLAALTILDAGPLGQVGAAAAAGWRSVGLRLQPLLPTDVQVVGHPTRERELRRLLAETGVGVLEIGVFPIRPVFDAKALAPALDFSAAIGAKFVVAPVEDFDLARRADAFAQLAEAAAAAGLRALVEFNPYSACRTLACACVLLDQAGARRAGLCLDALHFFRSGGDTKDLTAAIAERIALLHFCDAAPAPIDRDEDALRRESRTARRLPGEGVLPLAALLGSLPKDLPISLEAPSPRLHGLPAEERARRALDATRAWFEAALGAG